MEARSFLVLVVDDDRGLRRLASQVLGSAGIQALEAAGVGEGIEVALRERPHLVILDLALGERETGFEFLDRAAASEALREIPVIVLSGSADRESVSRALDCGARDFLAKPLNAVLLSQKVRQHLEGAPYVSVPIAVPMEVRLDLPCKITGASADGLQLESSLCLGSNSCVQVAGGLQKEAGLPQPFPARSAAESHPCGGTGFQSELRFRGLTKGQLADIRKAVDRWHT
jgi:CheY-like chemotaxis protein